MRKVFTNLVVSAVMLLSLSIVSFTSQATHISGADFNYQCVGQDSFWVTLNLFRDCTGIAAPNRATVDFFSSCGQSFTVRLNKQNGANGTEISQLCPGSLNQSTCNGGPMPGMQQHIYAGLVVLSPKCDFWTMQWSLCCRNTTVNLVGQPEMMVEATMYSQTDSCNNSPVFNAQPILYVCLNQNVDYNFAVTEADGDSFVYEFVEPLDQMVGGVAQAVPFAAGYTYTQPIAGITLNTATGQLQFTPTIQGNFVLAVRVCEYDYQTGDLLGCIIRDIQFVVIPCSNQAPQPPINGISSFSGTGSLIANDSVLVCIGNTFSFDIVFTDADTADSVVLVTNVTQVIPGATAVITNGNPATVTISGVATAAMPIINTFIVNANDGACPIPATATAGYNIIVQPLPIVDAGADQIICKDDVPINISAAVQFATGGTWSGNGTFGSGVANLVNSYTPTAAELAAGNAQLIVTSTGNLNCSPVMDTLNIQLVSFVAGITLTSKDVSCNGGNDGEACVVLVGGAQPVQVVWNTNPVQNGDTATNLTAGTYSVTLIDSNGCDTILSVNVAEPVALATSITSQVDVACTGGNDGQATIQTTGGVIPYSYLWSASAQNQTTTTATSLFAGSHSVTVTDANGCTAIQIVNVTQPNYPISVTVNTTDVTCFGDLDGSATATPFGGTAPYVFNWGPNGQTNNPLINIGGGTYSVTVTDNSGLCVVQTGIVVNEPFAISGANTSSAVLCNGDATGIASFTPTGGTTPFSFQWSPGAGNAVTPNVNNLSAGTYSVTLTDANNCLFDTSIFVGEPNALLVTTIDTMVSCNGGGDGSSTVQISGGVAPYVSTWSTAPVQTGNTVIGLSPGNFTATVTDSNGCVETAAIVITEPLVLSGTLVSSSNVSCTGGFNGEATVSGVGGSTPYTYLWGATAGNQTTANVDSLFAGTYPVTITDANGCIFVQSVTLTEPVSALSVSLSVTSITCNGLTDGTATAFPTGGTAPYVYDWAPSNQSTATITGLPVSNNTVTVTDNSGDCIVQTGILITQPDSISSNGFTTDVICNGDNSGYASVTGAGGTRPFSYVWDVNAGSQTDSFALNLAAGSYVVSITDGNGCQYDSLLTVLEPNALALQGLPIPPLCFGGADGSIEAVASGGISPYTYSWGGAAANQVVSLATSLSYGMYSVTITDSNLCTLDSVFTLNQPTPVSTSMITLNPVACFGDSSGSADIIGAGGTTPYYYQWNTSSSLEESGNVFGMAAGTYTVTVTDTNGCQFDTTLIITQPSAPLATTSTIVNVACFGDSTAQITALGTGGTSPYTYLWDSLANMQNTSTIAGLSIGSYQVWVTDSNGCQDSLISNVTQPLNPLVVNGLSTDVLCFGESTGQGMASGFGGTSPYTFLWDNNANNQTTAQATNLSMGIYFVTITDSLGCISDTLVEVFEPAILDLNGVIVSNVNCFNGSDAAIGVSSQGGVMPYAYQWGASAFNQIGDSAVGLTAGTHHVVVTDSNGCVADSIIAVTEPSMALNIDTNHIPVSCNGGTDGVAIAIPSGGTSPYSFFWNGILNQGSDSLFNLTMGSYSVMVKDTNGCLDTAIVQISEPNVLVLNKVTNIPVLCYGNLSGSATVTGSGGVAPYQYQWPFSANYQTDTTAINLGMGAYVVTVTDTNGCVAQTTVSITQPQAPISNTITSQPPLCNGDTNGFINSLTQGGTMPYVYTWSTGQIGGGSSVQNIGAGTYYLTISDTNGCVLEDTVVLAEPNALLFSSVTAQSVLCYGGNTGSAAVSASGGTLPYQYSWGSTTGSQSTPQAINLVTGIHSIQITDANGCLVDSTILVGQPSDSIAISSIQNDVNCFNGNDGTVSLTITGGTMPYISVWSANATLTTLNSASGLTTGSYSTTVTDANGCMADITVVIDQPNTPISMQGSSTDVSCFGFQDGAASMTVNGGTSPYVYNWDVSTGGQTGMSASNLVAGVYNGFVEDNNGCKDTIQLTVIQPQPIALQVSPDDTVCTQSNFNLEAQVFGGNGNYVYTWNNGLGNFNFHTTNTINSNTYTVSVTDGIGCPGASGDITITVFNIQADSLSVWRDRDVCEGETAYLFANYNSNFGSFTYQWSSGLGTGSGPIPVSPIQPTLYQVTVTDQCNSSVTDFVLVNVMQTPIVNIPAIIEDGCGPLTVTFEDLINDSGTYNYFWDFGDGVTSTLENPTHIFSQAGTYPISVSKTSSQGCTGQNSGSSVVTVFPSPVAYGEPSTFVTDITSPTIQFTDMSTGANSFRWDFSTIDFSTTANASYTYPDTGTYPVLLSVANQFGCESNYRFEIQVVNTGQITVPNAFTPDGNGGNGGAYDAMSLSNDVFYPRMGSVQSFNMTIFNRWGEMVFESKDVSVGWDGYYRDQIQAQDVYVWKIEAVFENGDQVSKVGSLTLLR